MVTDTGRNKMVPWNGYPVKSMINNSGINERHKFTIPVPMDETVKAVRGR
jgi:hypothetical protein